MNIPLDNIYDFIEGRLKNPAVMYLFYPNGSRKISHLRPLRDYDIPSLMIRPRIICHDQEPLNFDLYQDHQTDMQDRANSINLNVKTQMGTERYLHVMDNNLNLGTYYTSGVSIYDSTVLLHSELNSPDLDKYVAAGFEPTYWWSHAAIARDWYRFAEFDHRLGHRHVIKRFLIHARGFTNQREYRLKFLEKLIANGLLSHCKTSMLHQEQGIWLQQYRAQDERMQVTDPRVFETVPECQVLATASASYDPDDITSTALSVVCETQFIGSKIHLTEKILRPIACGHPFILLAAPGALALLRRYGFDTFSDLIDESYDLETDDIRRLDRVVTELSRLSNMSKSEWESWQRRAQITAEKNRARFFSQEFANVIWQELFHNLDLALERVTSTRGAKWLENRKRLRESRVQDYKKYLGCANERLKLTTLRQLRQSRPLPRAIHCVPIIPGRI